jgi:fumarylacetoacetase
VFQTASLNKFMEAGPAVWEDVRRRLVELLRDDNPELRDNAPLRQAVLIPRHQVQMCLPAQIGDYTDFYSSRDHATNVGSMLRGPANALQPNWLHLPVAYHGRASSIVVSGSDVVRPCGQTMTEGAPGPRCGPTRALDFELEVGYFIGVGNALGQPIPASLARQHVFGLVLVNDWSARDIQKWEYQPLGPFLSKNFATTISPWIVPLDALEPFRVAGPEQDPPVLPYLQRQEPAAYDIELEVELHAASGGAPLTICRSNFRYLYWTIDQQVAHHTCGGCNLRPGDLLASGTVSGPAETSRGCLLEITWGGSRPIQLPDGTLRRYLEDGDHVTLRGWCQGPGYRIGLGEATGRVLAARQG